jgi:hypothetical protein
LLFSAESGGNFPKEEVQIYMEYDKADLDKDGNISKEEFKVWLENRRQ